MSIRARVQPLIEKADVLLGGKKPPAKKSWKCQECGLMMTPAAAEKAANGTKGCPKCGGVDIDLAEATGKTYAKAREEILAYLTAQKWEVKPNLKIPQATSPDGGLRLWFKTQAVWFTQAGPKDKHDFKNARTLDYSHDIRTMSPEEFVTYVQKVTQGR